MELNREHFRAIISYNFRSGLTQQHCIDELNSIFGNEAPSRTSIYPWYGEFNRGRSSLQDEFREGRLKSVVVAETIDAVRQLILQDCHVSSCEIETTLGISGTSIHSILHEHLTIKKISSRWTTQNLSIAQKKTRVDWSKEMLQCFIVTCDTTWIYVFYFLRTRRKRSHAVPSQDYTADDSLNRCFECLKMQLLEPICEESPHCRSEEWTVFGGWFSWFLGIQMANKWLCFTQNWLFCVVLAVRLWHVQFFRKNRRSLAWKCFVREQLLLDLAHLETPIQSTAVYFRFHTRKSTICHLSRCHRRVSWPDNDRLWL